GVVQRAGEPHLLAQSALGRATWRLVRPRMSARRVRPQPRAMILSGGALLQDDPTRRSADDDRDRPVEYALLVRAELLHDAELAIVGVDENDDFLRRRHYILGPRKTALANSGRSPRHRSRKFGSPANAITRPCPTDSVHR